jgi:hypothetical protein
MFLKNIVKKWTNTSFNFQFTRLLLYHGTITQIIITTKFANAIKEVLSVFQKALGQYFKIEKIENWLKG